MKESEPYNPETENLENVFSRLSEMTRELGFIPSQEMESLVSELGSEKVDQVITKWRLLAEAVAEQAQGDDWYKSQIGLLVEQARLILKIGMADEFILSIDDAIIYADQTGLQEIAQDLETLVSAFRK